MVTESLVTAEELLAMPRQCCELVRGELRTMGAAGFDHGVVIGRISFRLSRYVEENDAGVICGAETGFILERDPDTVRAPDVAFVRRARYAEQPGFFHGAPDLAVEVVSPSDSFSAVQEKARSWIEAGAASVWVVDPVARAVSVFGRSAIQPLGPVDVLTDPELFPGLELQVAELFPQLDRSSD